MTLARRQVAVFIDYQNCYNWARRAFYNQADPSTVGHFNPRKFAEMLAGKGPGRFDLVYCGAYCGLPDGSKDPATYAARRKQMARWTALGATPVARPLRYPHGWVPGGKIKPIEKGVDVKLAVDAVMMALRGEYEVGIIASCDSDLAPAVEAIIELSERPVIEEAVMAASTADDRGGIEEVVVEQVTERARKVSVEVVAWKDTTSRLSVPGRTLTERWVSEKDFRAVSDSQSYGTGAP